MTEKGTIKEAMLHELENSKTARSGELQAGELEALHKLTDIIKNIDKICLLEEEKGYSQDGGYGGGSSYANRGKHLVRSHYSREGGSDGGNYGGGMSNRGGSRGGSQGGRGYSRGDGAEEMMEHIRMAIDAAPDEYREDMRRFMRQLEQG